MRRTALALAVIASVGMNACSKLHVPGPGEGASPQWLLAPAAALATIQNGYLGLPALTAGLTVWALADPFAPNWEIRAARLDERHLRFFLHHKLLHTGGDGEARVVLKRNAERITREEGFSEYEIVRLEEGIELTRPFARRTLVADVRMLKGRALPGL